MAMSELTALAWTFLALIGLNNPFSAIALIAAVSAMMRLLPWEKGRPWRPGFFLVAPLVATAALVIAVLSGFGAFYFVMFGIFEDKIAMPWLTFLPALAIGHVVAVGFGYLVATKVGRVLQHI